MPENTESFLQRIWLELEYNPGLTIPNAAEIRAKRPRRAQQTREHRKHLYNLRTGQHPREVLDLF